MKLSPLRIVSLFLAWRVSLTLLSLVAVEFMPLRFADKFLGGGPGNYLANPYLFSWANFDGEHYLSISIFGYKGLEQVFFPLYPKLIWLLSSFVGISSLLSSTIIGLVISNMAFLVALVILWKLINLDFSGRVSSWSILLLILFPTSYYFGSVYTESLFFLLVVSSFYLARKDRWFIAGILGALASATRVFGILLLPSLLLEAWQKKANWKQVIPLFIIPTGFLCYMLYQYLSVGDALAFYNLQKRVGEQHQLGIVLLPQVFFRYVKMLLTANIGDPLYQTIVLEFITGIIFLLLPIYGYFKKMRPSYILFALSSFLLPTVGGSFTSLPRYVLVIFPSFIASAIFFSNLPKWVRVLLILISCVGLGLETILFLRGYWVA